ncbi:MAG: hypothetical protein WBA23_23480 [Tunicatimonas sp.]|uniref:fluoroquinolone export ABC transporter permease subunit n=1 Tax=Tunicatimonas sp. TaxID=1940096 RepID=UPI003C770761
MKALTNLLRWDLLLLHRNQLIVISLALAGLYLGVFYLLKDLGNLEKLLVLLIYNDPVVTGLMFIGALVLFEKDQHTLEALAVSPLSTDTYLWSKAISLTLVALGTSLMMAWAGYGWQFQYVHFVTGVIGASLFYIFLGGWVVAQTNSFNQFLVRMIPLLILTALPFIPFFGAAPSVWFYPIPSYPSILLLQATFEDISVMELVYAYGYGTLAVVGSYYLARASFRKHIWS